MVDRARAGGAEGVALAAQCELELLAYRGGEPNKYQIAGAVLRAWHREDTRIMASGQHWKE